MKTFHVSHPQRGLTILKNNTFQSGLYPWCNRLNPKIHVVDIVIWRMINVFISGNGLGFFHLDAGDCNYWKYQLSMGSVSLC